MISIAWALLGVGCAPACGDLALLEQRECAVEAVIETLDATYPAGFIALKELDLEGLYADWRALPGAHGEPEGFGAALTRGVAGLHDGHTGLVGPLAPRGVVQVRAHMIDGELVLAHIPASAPGLLPGDRVLFIGGEPVDEALAAAMGHGSTEAARALHRAQAAFVEGGVFDGGLVVERGGEEVHTVVIGGDPVEGGNWHSVHGEAHVLRVMTFEHPGQLDWLDSRMNDIVDDAEALVLDLRGNGGGSAWLVDSLLGRIFSEAPPDYPILDARGEAGLTGGRVRPRGAVFTGPVAVLVDAGSASAANYLAHRVRSAGRGLVCGAPTGGGAGSPSLRVPISPGLDYVGVEQHLVGPQREDLELGLAPDPVCAVSWTRAQLEAGLDSLHGAEDQGLDLALALALRALEET